MKITRKEAERLGLDFGEAPKKHKFNAKATTVDGVRFDSKAEAKRWGELKLLNQAGTIRGLVRQQERIIWVNGVLICRYRSDFEYYENGELVVEDVKGVKTPDYRIKKLLMEAVYGIKIREIS